MFLSIDILFLFIDVFLMGERLLSSEVIEANHIVFHTERVEKVEHRLCHHWRTAEVVLAIFR